MLMPQIPYQLFEEGLFHNELATFCRHSGTQDLTFKSNLYHFCVSPDNKMTGRVVVGTCRTIFKQSIYLNLFLISRSQLSSNSN